MKPNKKILFVLGLIILVGIFHYKLKARPSEKEIESFSQSNRSSYEWTGKIAPNFQLQLTNGEQFSLDNFVGKQIIILNFFATWCEPYKEELPELNNFFSQHKDSLVMIGIDGDESEDTVRNFIKENGVSFPTGIDAGSIVSKKYGVDSFPTTVIIGPDGKIYFYEIGAIYNTRVTLEPIYNSCLKMLRAGTVISKQDYLREEKLTSPTTPKGKEELKLTEQEESIAKKIYCPRGCGKNLIECNCSLCKKVVEEIREEIKKNKSDKEIVKIINLRYCREK